MTFEQLLTSDGKHPELVEFLYGLQHVSNAWMNRVIYFNSNHQADVAKLPKLGQMYANQICALVKTHWNETHIFNGTYIQVGLIP